MEVLYFVARFAVSYVIILAVAYVFSIFGYNIVPPEPVPVRGFEMYWAGAVLVIGVVVFDSMYFENVRVSFPGFEARNRAIERKRRKWEKRKEKLMHFI